ncbi:MAG: GNAT family N-acetyltransferase [Bacteroidales bacterium]
MIIQAIAHHLVEAVYIYKTCVPEMNQRGLFNWNTAYPSKQQVEEDIKQGSLYLFQENHTSIGVVCINEEEPEEYKNLDWKYPGPSLFVHRMAVLPAFRNNKIAEKMMDFTFQHAKENRYKSIRLDAILKNPPAIRLYEKTGYEPVADIHLDYQKDLFRCMEIKVK